MKLAVKVAAVAGAALILAACSGGGGAEYPDRSISVIVPVPAGSGTDLATRLVTPCLEEELGQSIVVENREGGSGAVGNGEFVRAEPDGYTLVSTTAANAVLPELMQGGVGFSAESFKPIGLLGQAPIVLITAADSGLTAEEVLADASTIGIPGATSVPGLVLEGLINDHGIPAEAVPFDGNANTVQAVLSGEVPAAMVSADTGVTMPRIEEGQIEAIGTAVEEAPDYLGDVPTLASIGYTDLPYADSFWFLGAQQEVPDDVMETLRAATETCMTSEEVTSALKTAAPTSFVGGDEVASMLTEAEEGYAKTLGGGQ